MIEEVMVSITFADPDDPATEAEVRIAEETDNGVDGRSFPLVELIMQAANEYGPSAIESITRALETARVEAELSA